MKIKQKLSYFFLGLFSILIGLAIPTAFIWAKVIEDNLQIIPQINMPFIIWLVIAIVGLVLAIVYAKWIRVIWNRKLQAIAVVKEFQTVPDKSPVLSRILKSLEYIWPVLIVLALFHSLTFLSESFITLRNISLFVSIGLLAMQIILLFRDIVDNHFKNEIRISVMENDELKKDVVYLKRLQKGMDKETGELSNKSKRILEIKNKIKELESQNIETE